MITLNIRIEDGVNVDGVTITPQIEVGSQATDYQTPSNTAVEIPLLGTDGQILEPLREVSGKLTGESGAAYPFLDRIVRHGGVWAVERNVREYDLSEASWTKNTDYMYPYIGDYAIKSGTISNYVKCTHFPARGDASSQSAGAWLSTFFVIGNDVLPNGADTTVEKMKTYCQTQDSNGTPVKVCVPIDPPVYEELHQDVQVILNTLCVPGGTCSVWFEGDILPSGADIGLPRGDYPCSGVEGAYRWLAELSSPLPIPTRDDLYAWALEQQRGGVFATDGSTTTKNVPESGDLTGILSVAEQGTDVSMIVFGPTGKIHTATRMAGVWRGWTTLYSPLNKPNPADLGAAAADHNHSADQITSGILPLARGGLGASTWSTALDNLHGMARQATYYNETSAVDIDAITDGLALVPTAASKGCPISGSFVFIMQMFYGNLDTTRSRTQIAFPYAGGNGIAVRSYDSNKSVWSEWNLVYTANTPPPVMTGATSSKAGTVGLAPAPPAGAQDKYLRGDGTWQMPQDIASALGKCERSIYYEINRGLCVQQTSGYEFIEVYCPEVAERRYREFLKEKGRDLKIGKDHALARRLEELVMVHGFAPGAALAEIRNNGEVYDTVICENTLYNYIYRGDVFLQLTPDHLHNKGRRHYAANSKRQAARSSHGKSIETRPQEVKGRGSFGHWEMDSIMGCKGSKKALLVLTERRTRMGIVMLLEDHTAASVVKAINRLERRFGKLFYKLFKSITVDNGCEFQDFEGIEAAHRRKGKRTVVFFCHPYSAFERGSNENMNRLIISVLFWISMHAGSWVTEYLVTPVPTWLLPHFEMLIRNAASRKI